MVERPMRWRTITFLLLIGAMTAAVMISVSVYAVHETSTSEFCMVCHEMRIVGEQGWMKSVHYENPQGIVAQCRDCHIPVNIINMLWTKTRDGLKDIYVHWFGNAVPHQMDWNELRVNARKKIVDESCRKCHSILTPQGAPIKTIFAHREYMRMKRNAFHIRCIECHTEDFHGNFKRYLFDTSKITIDGRQQ